MVRNMITALDLRAVVARTRSREAGAGGWEAQRGKSRVAAAPTLGFNVQLRWWLKFRVRFKP